MEIKSGKELTAACENVAKNHKTPICLWMIRVAHDCHHEAESKEGVSPRSRSVLGGLFVGASPYSVITSFFNCAYND